MERRHSNFATHMGALKYNFKILMDEAAGKEYVILEFVLQNECHINLLIWPLYIGKKIP